MTRESILKKALEMANHNLYCASENYLMTRPKAGQEALHAEYAAEAELLKDWLEELADPAKAAKARFERDMKEARDGYGDIEIITDRRNEIAQLKWELEQIEEAAS